MNELFCQNITLIGESKYLLELLNINTPRPITAVGIKSPFWHLTHLHFKAVMRGSYPIKLYKLSKEHPEITFAVTSGSTGGPTYRFLMYQGQHIPIKMSYNKSLQPHYTWAESLSLEEVKQYTKKYTPPNLEKVSKIIDVAIDDPDIEVKIEEVEVG